MQIPAKTKNKEKINIIIDWILHMISYTIVFIAVTSMFSSIYIDKNNFLLWSFIIVLIIYILNKTIKPILVNLTIPITAITLGLFYPFINVFILKIVDWLLRSHFEIKNILIAFLVAILLSITNFIMEKIIKIIIKKVKNYE